MPSFDIVSKIDTHELTNAVDQANREVQNRFDFKGSNAKYLLEKSTITLIAPNEFQLKQMADVLLGKLVKRNIDSRALEFQTPDTNLREAKQQVQVKQGIDQELGKQMVKLIKESKLKVQATIQGDQLRVTGKSRDDLQSTIALLRGSKLSMPLQYENFRD
jgi:uncharacterized protein YajQ (UPF0234 family)